MKYLLKTTTLVFILALSACAAQTTGRMGNVDCEALKNMDHSKMDHSTMTAEIHALHQACGISMDMPEGHNGMHH